ASWEHLHESDWRTLIWERSCGACHTTGFSSDDLGFAEMTVGCESCHGPASRHAGFGTAGEMTRFGALSARDEVTICASCHLQGGTSRTTGLNFARNYQAGDDLFADYAFDWSSLAEGTDDIDNPIDIHQKLLVRDVVVNERGDLRCGSCHQAHAMTHDKHAGLPRQEYCHLCHARDGFAVKEYRQACNVCEF
ncbi:MAG TPA: hypothetical protein VFP98_06325, partial [Candidatus Polarisedimenticolia bacterium]|nr:hypothetical protein [Candidatus Polarisedimenticolia bacterium]